MGNKDGGMKNSYVILELALTTNWSGETSLAPVRSTLSSSLFLPGLRMMLEKLSRRARGLGEKLGENRRKVSAASNIANIANRTVPGGFRGGHPRKAPGDPAGISPMTHI